MNEEQNATKTEQEFSPKIKVNFNIEAQTKMKLEESQVLLRKKVPPSKASKINYSLITELAILMAVEELEKLGEASELHRRIISEIKYP